MLDESTENLKALADASAADLFNQAPCGFFYTLEDGSFLKANRTFLMWLGISDEKFLEGKKFRDLLTVGGKIYYETTCAPMLRMQGFLREITLDLKGEADKIVPILLNANMSHSVENQPRITCFTAFNISDRKSYERQLSESRQVAEQAEARLKYIAQSSDALLTSPELAVSFESFIDFSESEFADVCRISLVKTGSELAFENLLWSDRINLISDLEDRGPVFSPNSLRAPILKSGRSIGLLILERHPNGSPFGALDLEAAEEVARRISSAIDASLLKLEAGVSAKNQRESLAWFSSTLGSLGDGVLAVDKNFKVTFLNTIAEKLLGFTAREAAGRSAFEILQIFNALTGERAVNPMEKVLAEGIIVELENNTTLVRRDGSQFTIEDSAAPIRDSLGAIVGAVLVFRDATERYKKDHERESLLAELVDERDLREKFVAALTHDLRSPLTAAKLSAQLVKRKAKDATAVDNLANRIVSSINRADEMVRDLLDANRLKAGQGIPLNVAACRVDELVAHITSELNIMHGNRFQLQNEAGAVNGFLDADAIGRVIENLGSNAFKYGADVEPITIGIRTENNQVEISVHNHGPAIPEEEQKVLFENYRRAKSAVKSGQKGWGIGLTLIKGITDAHGGAVTLVSRSSEGTTFTVRVPLDCRSI